MIHFNRDLFPKPDDAPLWEGTPPEPSSTPSWEGADELDAQLDLAQRILVLETEVERLEGTNLKLRAVLTAYAGILAAIEETARNYRKAGPF